MEYHKVDVSLRLVDEISHCSKSWMEKNKELLSVLTEKEEQFLGDAPWVLVVGDYQQLEAVGVTETVYQVVVDGGS